MHDELRKQKSNDNAIQQRIAFIIDETMMIDRMSRIRKLQSCS